ncbi:tetratricopeptide repeat protein [Malaciobacter mytili]|uniref:Tetratricopeptide repeat protein n=1 Tax=Malaciobacter mytili LMG 24559 TaxID=1032238 RepID=A0AAX2AHU2_9BACT|nr:hypothetical protein [Malaciobacter mytili]AXH14023.1 tetratricopeptide repeat protein [Malaciobacter mytili LMG 24559]RXK15071.1 hypothetical protein CP985_10440 [Malaciobacter mytili LMG 24559]
MKKLILILLLASCPLWAKPSMSQKTYDELIKAQKLMDKQDYKLAKTILEELLKQKKNDYEKSFILQTLANIHIYNNQYEKVEKAYEEIIKLNAFEEKNIHSIKYSLGKIYLSSMKYNKSLKLSLELLNSKVIKKEDIYENLILAYYYDKNYKKSIEYSKLYFQTKQKIDESWYKILYSSYIELKDYKNGIEVMKTMVKLFNTKEEYWVQLASLYQQTNQLKKSLSTLELAFKNSVLTKKDNILYFINILLQNEVYNKASLLLAKAVKENLIKEDKKIFEILVSSYINSKQIQKAINKLENSEFKEEKYQFLLANLYYNKHQFDKSLEVLNSIKTIKNSKVDGEKNILKALCYYELDNKKDSIKTLEQVVNNPYSKSKAKSILQQLRS